jgi:hypothetical protein
LARKKKKSGRTLIGYVLDSSGSMDLVKHVVPTMFNDYVDGQRKIKGEVLLTLTTFNTIFDTPLKNVSLASVPQMVGEYINHPWANTWMTPPAAALLPPITYAANQLTYRPYGGTALYDAIGKTVNALEAEATSKDKVLVVIHTDGYENSSREFTLEQIQSTIKRLDTDDSNWTFVFLGSGLDAKVAGGFIGIRPQFTYSHDHSAGGMMMASASLGTNTSMLRSSGSAKLSSYVDPNLGKAQNEEDDEVPSK